MWLRPLEYSDEQTAYFESLGRATVLAQNFEHNLKYVFGIFDLGRALQKNKLNAGFRWRAEGKALMARPLGRALKAQRKRPGVPDRAFAKLEAGRKARNYMAHKAAEAALFIPPKFGKMRGADGLKKILAGRYNVAAIERERAAMLLNNLREAATEFGRAVVDLAHADNVVARWSYEIQEKGAAIPFAAETYVDNVVAWVLEPLRDAGVAQALCSRNVAPA